MTMIFIPPFLFSLLIAGALALTAGALVSLIVLFYHDRKNKRIW